MKVEAFIIHLPRATARKPQVSKLAAALPMEVSVVEAVDGMELGDAAIASHYVRQLHRPRYPFALGRGEIACFLSHRKAWREIVERGLDAGFVVEDDVDVETAEFGPTLDLALAHMNPADVVRFPRKADDGLGPLVASAGSSGLRTTRRVGLGMQAQLVGREAAISLLSFTEVFDRPVDTTVQMQWKHGIRILTTRPIAIREVAGELGGTTAQKRGPKSLTEKLSREILRARYRFAVRFHTA
ncbi:glycosyl transferase [Chelativorans sp. ZYF759]|uniref:glycosyltransferase family 25 protein n=1 Tax=Chelativorans sp. ZYF759 TaxID=2692213 RepID=UPI00145D57A7|nr:glycosyl transferase [Chelativorans sp. ZYF759]